jgi:hypothetical protein
MVDPSVQVIIHEASESVNRASFPQPHLACFLQPVYDKAGAIIINATRILLKIIPLISDKS